MHGEAEWQGFESLIVVYDENGNVRKAVEHRPGGSRDEGRQECYIIGHAGMRIGISYRFHHKSPEHLDFQVDVLIDGVTIHRSLVKEHWHRVQRVDRVYRGTGTDVRSYAIELDNLYIPTARPRQGDDDHQDDPNDPPVDIGTVQIEVRRGQADKTSTHKESLVTDFRRGSFPPDGIVPGTMIETPLRIRAHRPLMDDGKEPIAKDRFVPDPRDVDSPWFTHVYKYRSLPDLKRRRYAQQDPPVTEFYPDAAAYLGIKSRNTNARISALEYEIRALRIFLEGRAPPTPPTSPSSSPRFAPYRKSDSSASSRAPTLPKSEHSTKSRPAPPRKLMRRSGSSLSLGFSGLTRARAISVSSNEPDEPAPGTRKSSAIPLLSDDSDDE